MDSWLRMSVSRQGFDKVLLVFYGNWTWKKLMTASIGATSRKLCDAWDLVRNREIGLAIVLVQLNSRLWLMAAYRASLSVAEF